MIKEIRCAKKLNLFVIILVRLQNDINYFDFLVNMYEN